VLVLVQNLPVPFDRRVWQESLALRDAGYDVTVVSPADDRFPPIDEVLDGIRVYRYAAPPEAQQAVEYLKEYGWALFQLLRATLKVRRRGAFDVVHYCNPPDLLFLVGLVLKLRDGTRTIFDQHDLGPELVRAKRMRLAPFFVFVSRVLERLTYAASDFVISTNESYRAKALERGHKRSEEVQVVRSAPAQEWAVPVSPDPSWRRGHEHLVAYLGVMGRQEGIEYLLEAARILTQDAHLDVQFTLVGSGPDRERLEALSTSMGLSGRVEFTGRVSDEVLKAILCSADVCVNPDEYNELNDLSTMNKIVEYMAMGRPIVQFDLTEGRFSAGDSSLYAARNDSHDFARCIENLLRSPELRTQLSEIALDRFHGSLAWENQAGLLTTFYARILAESAGLTPDRGADRH
jgi:glycosyltransferase involved in cell wall biosynthesis